MNAWTVVIPVKGTPDAKSRLNAPASVSQAIALDTVARALNAARVIVVTASPVAASFEALGARVVADLGGGLNAAIAQGIAAAGDRLVAVLLGDVPALAASELAAALGAAGRHPLAFVPDADGSGTVLITALLAAQHAPAFGANSRERHLAAGYVELEVPAESGLRRDVDTAEHLRGLGSRLGPRTRAAQAAKAPQVAQATTTALT